MRSILPLILFPLLLILLKIYLIRGIHQISPGNYWTIAYGLISFGSLKPLHAIEDEDYEQVFGVNVRGTLEIVRAASREMGAGGRVIVVTATI
ncbi:MAG: hypothetical protein AAF242_11945, partial [Bacteroidota bacterium]